MMQVGIYPVCDVPLNPTYISPHKVACYRVLCPASLTMINEHAFHCKYIRKQLVKARFITNNVGEMDIIHKQPCSIKGFK